MNSDSIHKSLLEKFKANDNGSSLEYYIKKTAWEEDSNHITKIYLVKDCETNDIVFFFGLKQEFYMIYKLIDKTFLMIMKMR